MIIIVLIKNIDKKIIHIMIKKSIYILFKQNNLFIIELNNKYIKFSSNSVNIVLIIKI